MRLFPRDDAGGVDMVMVVVMVEVVATGPGR